MIVLNTKDIKTIKPFIERFYKPKAVSHKGQNGKILIIGGSSLFHAASIWAAEVATYFTDIVHYSSTEENNRILESLKVKFKNGIIIEKNNLPDYIGEDDAILVGPGMVRKEKITDYELRITDFKDLLEIEDEAKYTYYLTQFLIAHFPDKRFVFDAGSLQMMEKDWLPKLKTRPVLCPHQKEFERLFGLPIDQYERAKKIKIVSETARKYKVVILLKAVYDIISDGVETYVVEGGNAGLTKGGTGDLLAGLTTAFYAKNQPLDSAVLASWVLKKAAETLYIDFGYWYNIDKLIEIIPKTLSKL